MTLITLNITKPKTSVHLTPSLDAPREIQVIDFANVGKPIFTLTEVQTMQRIDNGVTLVIISDKHPLKVLQNLLKEVDMGPEIVESNGDWFIRSKFNFKLSKELYTKLRVPEILSAEASYPLFSDIVESRDSYGNTTGGASHISTPSKLLAVVPSQYYPSLRMKSHQGAYLNDFDLSITNIDRSVPIFGMNSFVITLKLS